MVRVHMTILIVPTLPFDFYIPDYNTLIEFDGEQHFKPIKYFGGLSAFKVRKRRDDIKTEYAKTHNMMLIRIPYYEFNNISDILNDMIIST